IRDRNVTGVQTCALPISWIDNLNALPQDTSTYLIRFIPRATTLLGRIPEVPLAWPGTSSDDMTNGAQLQEVIDRANAEKAQLKKIGRASCRERGEEGRGG